MAHVVSRHRHRSQAHPREKHVILVFAGTIIGGASFAAPTQTRHAPFAAVVLEELDVRSTMPTTITCKYKSALTNYYSVQRIHARK